MVDAIEQRWALGGMEVFEHLDTRFELGKVIFGVRNFISAGWRTMLVVFLLEIADARYDGLVSLVWGGVIVGCSKQRIQKKVREKRVDLYYIEEKDKCVIVAVFSFSEDVTL